MKRIYRKILLSPVLLLSVQLLAVDTNMVDLHQDAEANLKPLIIAGFVPRIAPSAEEMKAWPKTISEAVDNLLASMSESSRNELRNQNKKDLIQYHLNWGMGIRNAYGLWRGNNELIESACGEPCHPDTASMKIIEAVWTALQHQTDQSSDRNSH